MRRQTITTQSQLYVFGALISVIVGVTTVPAAASGALSQGFTAGSTSITSGTLVSIQANTAGTTIEKATSDHAAQLVGVVADRPLVALDDNSQQLQVVTSGVTPVIVSDINGSIKAGDRITASPLEGIGMKALTSTQIIGTAESNLSSGKTIAKTITDIRGKKATIHIGTVSAQIGVAYYIAPKDRLSSIVPTSLINLANSIAGKDLSSLRVLIGFTTLLAGFIIAGIMLQTAVRSGIISLGRNPLARGILRQGLMDVFITSVVILLITIATFYLILKI